MTPGSGGRTALRDLHPQHTLAVPGAIVFSAALLLTGLSLPMMHARQMFWKSHYSVWQGVVELWKQNELALATVLFFFSIVFPLVKLLGLAIIWFWRLRESERARLLHWLEALGKWSMLDVFVVAILIVLVKLGPLAKVEPRVGVYVFAAAILSSMLTTMYVDRLVRASLHSRA
ncbi:MAG: paraquat-inducible protein A [Candidatus Omnitrophica bacterium]|nr:paraquat-inducible protein A [Candidatus Omnitrophota bacterium]